MKRIVDWARKEKRRRKRSPELLLVMTCGREMGKRVQRMQTKSMMSGCGEGANDVHFGVR